MCWVLSFSHSGAVGLALFSSHPLSSPLLQFCQEDVGNSVLFINTIGSDYDGATIPDLVHQLSIYDSLVCILIWGFCLGFFPMVYLQTWLADRKFAT